MSSITNNLSRNLSKSSNKSLLWSINLKNEYEVICCKQGKKIEGNFSHYLVEKNESFIYLNNKVLLLKYVNMSYLKIGLTFYCQSKNIIRINL